MVIQPCYKLNICMKKDHTLTIPIKKIFKRIINN